MYIKKKTRADSHNVDISTKHICTILQNKKNHAIIRDLCLLICSSHSKNMNTITIFCLVHGEPLANSFSVDIDKSKTISYLKELIKAKKTPEFDDVATDKLTLWRVNIRDDDNDGIQQLVLKNNDITHVSEMLPTRKIEKYFPDTPSDEHVHVVIEKPFHLCKHFYVCS